MPKSILLVDDRDASLATLARALEERGYRTFAAASGANPVARFAVVCPDLVVISLRRPEADGVCEQLRGDPDGAIVPIIFIGTGAENVRSPAEALGRGGDYYFEHPLDLEAVLAKVETYIGRGEDVTAAVEDTPTRPKPEPDAELPELPAMPPRTRGRRECERGASDAAELPSSTSQDVAREQEGDSRDRLPRTQDLTEASDALLAEIRSREAELQAEDERRRHDEERRRQRKEEAAKKRQQEEEERKRKEEEGRRKAEERRRKRQEEEQKREEERKRRLEEQKKRLEEQEERKRQEEEQKREEERKRRLEEQKKRLEEQEERKRQEEEQKREQERKRRLEEQKKRLEEQEERKRQEEEQKREQERKRRLEEQKRRLEEQEEAQSRAEDRRRRDQERAREREDAGQEEEEYPIAARRQEEPPRSVGARTQSADPGTSSAAERPRTRRRGESGVSADDLIGDLVDLAPEPSKPLTEEDFFAGQPKGAKADQAELRGEEKAFPATIEEIEPTPAEPTPRPPPAGPRARAAHPPGRPPAAGLAPEADDEDASTPERSPLRGRPVPSAPTPAPEADPSTGRLARPASVDVTATRPNDVELEGLVPLQPEQGAFSDAHDVASVLASAWHQRVTGRVDFASEGRQKSVFFEGGMPVDAYSSEVYDRIEEYLYREGKIARAQYQNVRIKRLRTPRRVGAHLVTEGHLKPQELFGAVRGHLKETYYGLFEWEEGTYRFVAERANEDDRVGLEDDGRLLILEGVRRKYLMARLLRRLGSPTSLLGLIAGRELDMEALELSAGEQRLVRLVDGSRSVDDLVFSTGLEGTTAYQLLVALLSMGYAEVLVRGLSGLFADGTASDDEIDRARIQEKNEQVRRLDYFDVLGVQRNATPYEIERASAKNLEEFAPERFSQGVRKELSVELEEIRLVVEDAQVVLGDDAVREAYLQNLL